MWESLKESPKLPIVVEMAWYQQIPCIAGEINMHMAFLLV